MNLEKVDDVGDSSLIFMNEIAKSYKCFVYGGRPKRYPDGKGRNEACLINPPGQVLLKYVKIHPFTSFEAAQYIAGDEILHSEVGDFAFSPFICYDLRFPEVC